MPVELTAKPAVSSAVAASESLTLDRGLDLLDLAQQLQSVTPADIEFRTVPIVDPDARDGDGSSIVQLADEETLHAFFATLSAEPGVPEAPAAPVTVAPSEVSVDVYNGSGISGLAAEAAGELETAGFTVGATGNADSNDYSTTTIRYAAGDEALAATLAAQVPGAVSEVSDDATSGTVQLVLGEDFNGIGQPTSPPADTGGSPAPVEEPRTAADTSCIN